MRPPDYDLEGIRGEVLPVRIATGGIAAGLNGHLHVIVEGPADVPAGRLTLRHRETGKVALRVDIEDHVHVGPDSDWRLELVGKP